MAEPNTRQKIIILDIEAQTQTFIEEKLLEGYLIQSITNLQPSINKILIVYALNELPPISPP